MSSQAETVTLSTDEFWERMCQPGFVRLSLNMGVIEDSVFFTANPPEMQRGFLGLKLAGTEKALSPKPIKWPWFNWSVNREIRAKRKLEKELKDASAN